MKVVIAIDSLKGSLTSMEAGNAIRTGITRVFADADITIKPLADGGEGTTDALIEGLNAKKITVTVKGPLGTPVETYYGYLEESHTAIIEMASAAGITLLPAAKLDPWKTTTYGVGQMIRHALDTGARHFIIGIGGSATNDGGIGMLKALGFSFLDRDGNDVGEGGQALGKVTAIRPPKADEALERAAFRIACDVRNPLYGENGATYIFGPQKGAASDQLESLDQGMQSYASAVCAALGQDYSQIPGTGAAGGLGFAFLAFLKAELTPGVDLILEATGVEAALAGADYVITGEGQLDAQTAMGKAPIGVARLGKKHGAKVLAFAGSVTTDARRCNDAGIDAFFPIVRGVTTLAEAMDPEHARANMADAVEQVFRLL